MLTADELKILKTATVGAFEKLKRVNNTVMNIKISAARIGGLEGHALAVTAEHIKNVIIEVEKQASLCTALLDKGEGDCMKTLNEWMTEQGYRWVDGRERLYKAMLSAPAAQIQIQQLLQEGVIYHV